MKKLFVWDLHGTLEWGNHNAVIDISNQILERFGYTERFTYTNGVTLYGKKWYEYFLWLLGDDYGRAIELQEACFELSEANPNIQCNGIVLTPHADEVLAAINDKHDQILISNTRPATLATFVKVLNIGQFFPAGTAFAVDQHSRDAKRTKANVLAEFLGEGRIYDEIIIIGDSPSDMRLKEVSGGSSYLFTHPEFEFRACESDYRIRDLRGLLEVT